jgi:hypothetical protein
MNYIEAIEVLKRTKLAGADTKEAIETIKNEITNRNNNDLEVILAQLIIELRHSTSPFLSYHILKAIRYSRNKELENSSILRIYFISKILGSESPMDGIIKCMEALSLCTKYNP